MFRTKGPFLENFYKSNYWDKGLPGSNKDMYVDRNSLGYSENFCPFQKKKKWIKKGNSDFFTKTHPRQGLGHWSRSLIHVLHFSVWVKYWSPSHSKSSPPATLAHLVWRILIPRPQLALQADQLDHWNISLTGAALCVH